MGTQECLIFLYDAVFVLLIPIKKQSYYQGYKRGGIRDIKNTPAVKHNKG